VYLSFVREDDIARDGDAEGNAVGGGGGGGAKSSMSDEGRARSR
jgi:hypothetical protein